MAKSGSERVEEVSSCVDAHEKELTVNSAVVREQGWHSDEIRVTRLPLM